MEPPTGNITTNTTNEILTITICNPGKKNAISRSMWQEIKSIANEISSSRSIRGVFLQGEGTEAFASGADISEFEATRDPKNSKEYDYNSEAALLAVLNIPVPTFAVIRGLCFGGGLSLAMVCDYRLSDTSAQFAIPAARLGISYPFGSLQRLVGAIGPEYAKILLFSAERVDAERALHMNLLQEVMTSTELTGRIEQISARLRENAPLSILASKALVNAAVRRPTISKRTLELVSDMSNRCINSSDYKEGVRAFLERRPPKFTGS